MLILIQICCFVSVLRKIYHWGLRAYETGLRLAAPFHSKARLWVEGRKGWRKQLQAATQGNKNWIWFHAASLGEFEQGRPLIELIKAKYPHYSILLSFFSPSGYEIRKNYPLADYVCYLPMDYPGHACDFLKILQPQLAVFIKYELWLNYIAEMKRRNIPAILIAASLTADSRFLKSRLAPYYKEAFLSFRAIFTQEDVTVQLLRSFTDHTSIIPSRDTRYDRVLATQQAAASLPLIEAFIQGRPCIIAGSSWPQGEKALLEAFAELNKSLDICLIFAPHEIKAEHIQNQARRFTDDSWVLSHGNPPSDRSILWIDQIGMLSRLYRYADIAYIGGALGGHGLHNILEATAFGVPVLFGPRHGDKPEALALIEIGGAMVVEDGVGVEAEVKKLLAAPEAQAALREKLKAFIAEQAGASEQILDWLEETGLVSIEE